LTDDGFRVNRDEREFFLAHHYLDWERCAAWPIFYHNPTPIKHTEKNRARYAAMVAMASFDFLKIWIWAGALITVAGFSQFVFPGFQNSGRPNEEVRRRGSTKPA